MRFRGRLLRLVEEERSMVARKPTETTQYKLRLPDELGRQVKRLATKSGRSLNGEIVHLLENAVLAERAGVGGKEGVLNAIQGSSVAEAVRETIKQLGLDQPGQSKPTITKTSE